MDGLLTTVDTFIRSVRIADLLDIILVSMFFYALLSLLRRSTTSATMRSTLIITGGVILAYLLAKVLQLYLVQTLIQFLLVVILFVAVIVFQSDIRRIIDRLGTFRFFRGGKDEGDYSPTEDALVQAVDKLAADKTGALIAIQGKDPWDRYIHGGVELSGKLSTPLLLSLFNPNAPAHDGALMMDRDGIQSFASHLPLSTNLSDIGRYGTRHAAGLGLAERCDAFVIIVSEEHGTISVAENGKFDTISDTGELKKRLQEFYQKHAEIQSRIEQPWWRQRSIQTGILAVSLAILLWFLFGFRTGTVYRSFNVPVEFRNVPSNWRIQEPVPTNAQVTIEGSEQGFRLLDPTNLVLSFDVASLQEGTNVLQIQEKHIQLPADLGLYQVSPEEITIRAGPRSPPPQKSQSDSADVSGGENSSKTPQ
ncbi:MAG: diadenylate cyclase CdaA [Candidatus Marinimicrobia bacterium]|nr:diadenylate cyclase CdaA [Candidatus Neomarinimicrobiota bacterium]